MSERDSRLRFEPVVTAGNLISALLIVGTATAYIVSHGATADRDATDVAALRAEMNSKFAEMSALIAAGQADVRAQIQGLPDQRARLGEIERRTQRADQRAAELDVRLRAVEQSTQHVSDLVDMLARGATAPPLPAHTRSTP